MISNSASEDINNTVIVNPSISSASNSALHTAHSSQIVPFPVNPSINSASYSALHTAHSSQIVPFPRAGVSDQIVRGASIKPVGTKPFKSNLSGKTKAWDWNRWSSNGYTDFNEKVLLFGVLDPNPASQDLNDPTVGYTDGFDIIIGELGKPRNLHSYDVPSEFKTREDASTLSHIIGPFYSSEVLKQTCDAAFGNRFHVINTNGFKGNMKRGYLKNFTCQSCKAVTGSSCKFRLQYEVFIDTDNRLCLMLRKCTNEHVNHNFTNTHVQAIASSGGAYVPERLEALAQFLASIGTSVSQMHQALLERNNNECSWTQEYLKNHYKRSEKSPPSDATDLRAFLQSRKDQNGLNFYWDENSVI